MPTIPHANTSHRRRARFLSSWLRRFRPRTRAKQRQAEFRHRAEALDISIISVFTSHLASVAVGTVIFEKNASLHAMHYHRTDRGRVAREWDESGCKR